MEMTTARCSAGFSLVEQLISLLMVTLAAVLIIQASAANTMVIQRATRKASAVRLGSELAAWVERGGHLALGMPLDQALTQLVASDAVDESEPCCSDDGCDASASAWRYLALWHHRFKRDLPDARWVMCAADPSALSDTDWDCGAEGKLWLLKLGWPVNGNTPVVVLPLGLA